MFEETFFRCHFIGFGSCFALDSAIYMLEFYGNLVKYIKHFCEIVWNSKEFELKDEEVRIQAMCLMKLGSNPFQKVNVKIMRNKLFF